MLPAFGQASPVDAEQKRYDCFQLSLNGLDTVNEYDAEALAAKQLPHPQSQHLVCHRLKHELVLLQQWPTQPVEMLHSEQIAAQWEEQSESRGAWHRPSD